MGLQDENDSLRYEIRELRAALGPFAKIAAHYAAYQGEDFETKDTVHGFTIGQFRRAREALGTAAPAGAPSEDRTAQLERMAKAMERVDYSQDYWMDLASVAYMALLRDERGFK